MSEKSLWTKTRAGLLSVVGPPNNHLTRFENYAGPGTPDVHYCVEGATGWVELKYLDGWPAREATVVKIDHFTPQQRTWLHDCNMSGGRCFVWIAIGDGEEFQSRLVDFFLFDGLEAAMFLGKDWKKEDFYKKALLMYNKKVNWEELMGVLLK